MRVRPLDDFAVHLQDQAKHAVRRRMLRPDIDRMAVDLHDPPAIPVRLERLRSLAVQSDVAHRAPLLGSRSVRLIWARLTSTSCRVWCTFSSPGNVTTASQGDSKSKLRNSWLNRTGSLTTRF